MVLHFIRMVSLYSALALCIILLVIIELSDSEADIQGKRIRNKKIKSIATPLRRKHAKTEKHVRPFAPKRSQHKSRIKHGGSIQAIAGPKWNKKHAKKESLLKKVQCTKITKPRGQRRRSMLVNKIKNQKGLEKSFPKRKTARQLPKNNKRISKKGIKRTGRWKGLKVGIKRKKILGTKIKKFNNKKLMNEVLTPRKDGVPVKPKLPLKTAHASLNNQVPKSHAEEKDYTTISTSPSSTYFPMHNDEPEKQKTPVKSRPETTSVTYSETPEIIESLKKIDTNKTSLPHVSPENYKGDTTTEISNEIPTKGVLDIIFGPVLAKVKRDHLRKNFNEPLNNISKKSTKAKIPTTTTESIRRKHPNNFFGVSSETASEFYFKMHCAFYENKICYQLAAPSECHEKDWSGKCINATFYLKYLDEKTYKEVTVPVPRNEIRKPEPGDFHLISQYKKGLLRRCVVHRKWDGLIKDTCVDFNDVLKDIPRLSEKIIEVHYGYYSGNGNKREDRMRALDAIEEVLNGYGTCERLADKFPFLRQYFLKYAEPCLQ